MTREDLKKIFYEYKNAERKLRGLRNRLAEIRSDYSALSSALSNVGMPHGGSGEPKIERLTDKLLEVEKRYITAIETFMTAEDRLHEAFAIADLTTEERDVLIDAYVNGKPAWKTAQEMGWSDRTVKRRKHKAIEKLCKN
jgi:DNA-binding NarL/FixJ family response regulator